MTIVNNDEWLARITKTGPDSQTSTLCYVVMPNMRHEGEIMLLAIMPV